MRHLRWLKHSLSALVILLLTLLLGFTFLLSSQAGLQLSFSLLQKLMPGKISVDHLQGRLLGQFELTGFSYEDDKVSIKVDRSKLSMQPWTLLSGQLRINKVNISGARITIKAQEQQTDNPSDQNHQHIQAQKKHFLMPIRLRFPDIRLNQLSLTLPSVADPIVINKIIIKGSSDFSSIFLEQLSVNNDTYQLTAKAQLSWTPYLSWQTNLNAKTLSTHLNGTLNATLSSQGQYQNNQLETQFKLTSLEGAFNGQPLSGNIDLNYGKNGLNIAQMEISLGDNQLNVSGQVNQLWSLDGLLEINDLSQIMPQSQGVFSSQVHISGPLKTPRIDAQSDLIDFTFNEFQIAQLDQQLQLDLGNNQQAAFNLTATGLAYQQYPISELIIDGAGTLDQHHITIDAQSDDFENNSLQIQAHIDGQYQDAQWTGELQDAQFNYGKSEPWSLQNPASWQLAKNHIELTPTCLRSVDQQICLSTSWQQDQSWYARLSVKHFDSNNLSLFLPDNIELQTRLNLALKIEGQQQTVTQGDLELTIEPGQVTYNDVISQQTIPFLGGKLEGHITDLGTDLALLFQVNHDNAIQGKLTLAHFQQLRMPAAQQAINGSINITMDDMSLVSDFLPQIDIEQGKAHWHSTIDGSLARPEISGEAALHIVQLTIHQLGLALSEIELNLDTSNHQQIHINGQANSGDGQLAIDGDLSLIQLKTLGELTVSGENFQVINNDEYQVTITPSLQVRLHDDLVEINGHILIPQATIKPSDFTNTLTLPDDVVFIDEPAPRSMPLKVASQIDIIIGEDVNIDIMGLSARLQGRISIEDHPDQVTTARGEISLINGEFNIFGQTLDVERGLILYGGGPIDSPDVDIRATRTIENVSIIEPSLNDSAAILEMQALPVTMQNLPSFATYTVGVEATGPARNPDIQLFSEPSTLDQADILSLLLFGVTLSNQKGSSSIEDNAGALIQAASTLNVGGFQFSQILNRVQNTLGLSQIELQTQQIYNPDLNQITNATALVLGKALTSRIFINYSLSLFDQRNILRLSYLLSNHWSIQSITDGSNNGVDLLFTLER